MEQPPKAGRSPGLALIADVSGFSESSEFAVWIGDAGASYHLTDSTALMFNLRPSSLETINGIGESARKVQPEGALILEFVEEQSIVKFDRVLYVPDLGYNLFPPLLRLMV